MNNAEINALKRLKKLFWENKDAILNQLIESNIIREENNNYYFYNEDEVEYSYCEYHPGYRIYGR